MIFKRWLKRNPINFIGALCAVLIAGLLFIGLWPLAFSPRNWAEWSSEGGGLYFQGFKRQWKLSVGGIAYLDFQSSSEHNQIEERGSFSVAIRLQPASEVTGGVPHIFTMSEKTGEEYLYLGQWKQCLIVRWFGSGPDGKRKLKEIAAGGILLKDQARWVTLVSDSKGTSIYAEGELVENFDEIILLNPGSSIRDYKIVLGNSNKLNSPWNGTVFALALFDHSLNKNEASRDWNKYIDGFHKSESSENGLVSVFDFSRQVQRRVSDMSGNGGLIVVPERIVHRSKMLMWPKHVYHSNDSKANDIITNIIGFIPFGFIFFIWIRKKKGWNCRSSFLFTVILGGLISLSIESVQAFMPARDSSILDLIHNTMGTMLGALFILLILSIKSEQ